MRRHMFALLQRHQRLPRQAEGLGQRLREAKSVEHKQVQKLRKAKEETNPYHKAQYITAFVEAHSAEMVHSRLMKTQEAEQSGAMTVHDLGSASGSAVQQLSRSLNEKRLTTSTNVRRSSLPERTVVNAPPSRWSGASAAAEDVPFGAWRSPPPPLVKQAASVDFLTHCVLREATTPPAWSAHALHRLLMASPTAKNVSDFTRHVQIMAHAREQSPGHADTVDVDKLYASFHKSRVRAEVVMRDDHVNAIPVLEAFDSCVVQQIVLHLGWRHALSVVSRHLAAARAGGLRGVAPSQLVGVFAEAVRQGQPCIFAATTKAEADMPLPPSPPFESIRELAELASEVTALQSSTSTGSPHMLAPVAAAPVLSLLAAPRASAQNVVSLAENYLIQKSRTGHGRQYLPAIAWGEYLRALHRCGADLATIQAATDTITDGARTKHSEALLQSPHLWRAYVESCAVSHVQHAWDVFHENAKHYHVERTPALTAAMMQTLLSSADPVHWEKAAELWKASRGHSPKVLTPTTSMVAAGMHLHERSKNGAALASLCTDYDGFYAYYGVTHEQWAAAGGAALHKVAERAFEGDGASPFLAVVSALNKLSDLNVIVPTAIALQMQKSLTRLHMGTTAVEDAAVPEMTAEMLADLL